MKYSFLILIMLSCLLAKAQQYTDGNKGASPLTTNREQPSTVKNTYAVVVGISDYQDPGIPDLRFADKDAEAFANYLKSKAGGNLDADHLKVLLNEKATVAQFAMALDWLMEVVKENDQVILYFSGHGDVEKKTITQPGYLLCWDAPARVYLAGGALALPMFQDIITTLSAQNKAKVIVITDACRSGKLAGSSVGGSQITGANLAKQYANEIKILSCQPNEYSIEGEQWGGGRGAFSYHLIDALYGLADNNNDLIVNLQEAGRYIEDHVSAEVAPISQLPMVLGNRADALSKVDSKMLASIKSGKSNQMSFLSSIDSKGMEDDILVSVDTSVRLTYKLFKQALKEKVFLEPVNACAEKYYSQLINEPKLERLHSTLKRNYAAALMDEGQQFINLLLKSDPKVNDYLYSQGQIDVKGIHLKLRRAAELLGPKHYIYNTLKAKENYFKAGIFPIEYYSGILKDSLANLQRKLLLDGLSYDAHAPYIMNRLLAFYELDSFRIMADRLEELCPNWAIALGDIGYGYYLRGEVSSCIEYYKKSIAVDSTILPTYFWMGVSFATLGDHQQARKWWSLHVQKSHEKKALMQSGTYLRESFDLGNSLLNLQRYEEAEHEFEAFLKLDSLDVQGWYGLGVSLYQQRKYEPAKSAYQKSLNIYPKYLDALVGIGAILRDQNRFSESEKYWLKVVELDSANVNPWNEIGLVKLKIFQYKEAANISRKVIEMDSLNAISWNNLGLALLQMHQYDEARLALAKAIALDSTAANSIKHLGTLNLRTGHLEEARIGFEHAIALDQNYNGGYLGQAYILLLQGDVNGTLAKVEYAIQKGATFEALSNDDDLNGLRKEMKWNELMKKHFPSLTNSNIKIL
ncbi:MAG: tetratricopeptide repeat protein [Saprospiraceae bacterium]|nr:tetratricopeptide repeat protein [Candidatus Vicinibacter affinis]